MNQSTSFIKRIIRSSKFVGGLAIVSGVLSSSAQTSVGFPGTMITSNAVVNALGYVPASSAVSGTTPAQVTNIVATLSPTNGDTRNFSFPGGAWTFTGSSYLFTTIIDQALAGGSGSSFVLADAGGIPYITNYTFGTAAYSNANAFALSPTNVGTLGQVLSLTGNKTKWVTGSGGTPNYELNWQTDFLTYTNLPDGNLYYRGEVVSGVSSLYFYQNNTPFIAMNGSGFTVSVPVTNASSLTVNGNSSFFSPVTVTGSGTNWFSFTMFTNFMGVSNATFSTGVGIYTNGDIKTTGGIYATNLTAITATSDNAPVGGLGEYTNKLVAVGSAVSLTTATAANITAFALTAGDWDVEGNINFSGTTATVTQVQGGISSTSVTLPTDGSEVFSDASITLFSGTDSVTLPRKRISISSTTTIYLVGKAIFSAGTVGGFGQMSARRVR